VRHDHGVELDRARAALVLLGKLVAAGVPWTAHLDSDPARLHELFSGFVVRDTELAPILKREIAAFFVATTDVAVAADIDAASMPGLLRRAGADPALWLWAHDYPNPARCWLACEQDVERTVCVALACGVAFAEVARALAAALALLTPKVKTRHTTPRTQLATALTRLAGNAPLFDDTAATAPITKLAFELTAARSFGGSDKPDPLGELAVVAFQLVEAHAAARRVGCADVERFAELAARTASLYSARGLVAATLVRRELDPTVHDAIAEIDSAVGLQP
jgi:hypothetical protein